MGIKMDRMQQKIFTAQKAKEGGRVSLKKLNFWKI